MMNVYEKDNSVILDGIKDFDPKHIFECGQCFRWNNQADGSYTGVFKGNVMNVQKVGDTVTFKGICNGDIKEIVEEYFDLNRNYEEIKEQLKKEEENIEKVINISDDSKEEIKEANISIGNILTDLVKIIYD